ncbi:MAG: LamG domain-containing protein [Candidatus Parcubacteria bacterium]|nr:LamG domain-containing protein [Candidatus Parcubacteria bacterium]
MANNLKPYLEETKEEQSDGLVNILIIISVILLASSVFFMYQIYQLKTAKSSMSELIINREDKQSIVGNDNGLINDIVSADNLQKTLVKPSRRKDIWRFSGANDYISFADNVFNQVGPSGTFMAFFKAEEIPAERSYILSAQNLEDIYVSRMWLGVRHIEGGDKLDIEWVGDYDSDRLDILYNIELNKWYLVAYTTDISGNKVYINGKEVDTVYKRGNNNINIFFDKSVGGVEDTSKVKFDIGCLYYQPSQVQQGFFEGMNLGDYLPRTRCFNYFQGEIEHVSVWERALTAEEVKEFYDKKNVNNKEGLLAWWDLKKNDGENVLDQSGKGNDGEIHGFIE